MKDYKRLTQRDEFGNADIIGVDSEILASALDFDKLNKLTFALNKFADLEDKIERGKLVDRNSYLDYLLAAKNTSELTDKEIEFFVKHNARVREDTDKELAALQKRLENAVELPCIEPMTTWDWDDTTGLGKNNFGKYWQILYRDEDGEFIAYIGATKEEAKARLAELKGEGKQ